MIHFLRRYWILPLSLLLGIYAGLPFLAPVFMHFGWNRPAETIYFIYSFFCHQLPERSFFFFGPKPTYSLSEIQNAWKLTENAAILRQFIGNAQMGWKVAWSDRMVSMFTSLWLFSLLCWPIRRNLKRLPFWGLVLFLIPMAIDGTSHLVSDLISFSHGFRDTNLWLALITGHLFPATFYSGDAWGSFNSLMRLLSGILFGLGVVWYTYPYLEAVFSQKHQAPVVKIATASSQIPGDIH